MSKPLSPHDVAALNAVLHRACDRIERRRKAGLASDQEAQALLNAVADMENEETMRRELLKAAWADVPVIE